MNKNNDSNRGFRIAVIALLSTVVILQVVSIGQISGLATSVDNKFNSIANTYEKVAVSVNNTSKSVSDILKLALGQKIN